MTSWVSPGVTPLTLERALERLESVFIDSAGPEALLARREARRSGVDDQRLARELVAGIVEAQDDDGSWHGALVPTAESLLLLAELAGRRVTKSVERAARSGVDWLRRLRGGPGRFGAGCTPERHALGFCHHSLAGFFRPEPPLAPGEELVLSNGAHYPTGPAAQLAASCLALRACLRWGDHGPDSWLHLDGLRRLLEHEASGESPLVPIEAIPAILLALVEAHALTEAREVIAQMLARLVQTQRADGSWPELDAIAILEVLLAAVDAGFGTPEIDAAIRRGAGLLAVTQRENGMWERDTAPQRALTGWRVLRLAVRGKAGRVGGAAGARKRRAPTEQAEPAHSRVEQAESPDPAAEPPGSSDPA